MVNWFIILIINFDCEVNIHHLSTISVRIWIPRLWDWCRVVWACSWAGSRAGSWACSRASVWASGWMCVWASGWMCVRTSGVRPVGGGIGG